MYKPEGHSSVSPYLMVDDAEKALAFIKAVFGSDPDFIHRRDDGVIGHAEVKINDSVVMLGQSADGPDSHVHVYVSDIDAAFARAKAAGGVVMQEPQEKGDGDRRGGIQDPTGTTWWLSRMVSRPQRDETNTL